MSERVELKPCPCCGYRFPKLMKRERRVKDMATGVWKDASLCSVKCPMCIMQAGPCEMDSIWPVQAWNKRVNEKVTGQADKDCSAEGVVVRRISMDDFDESEMAHCPCGCLYFEGYECCPLCGDTEDLRDNAEKIDVAGWRRDAVRKQILDGHNAAEHRQGTQSGDSDGFNQGEV